MMAIRKKKAFGTLGIDHFSPDKAEDWPKAINIFLTFEEALKLHLGLGQLLGHLNSYNRSTKEGREAGVNLCVFTDHRRITIREGKVKA